MTVREGEDSLNKEILDRYQHSNDQDVHSQHHSVVIHHGNVKSKIHHKHNPKRQKKRDEKVLQYELRKLKRPTFNGEKSGEVAYMWLQEIKNYLQLHDYSDNQEVKISIFNL